MSGMAEKGPRQSWAVLCSFSSQVLSGAQQTVGADAKKTLLVTFVNENITFS